MKACFAADSKTHVVVLSQKFVLLLAAKPSSSPVMKAAKSRTSRCGYFCSSKIRREREDPSESETLICCCSSGLEFLHVGIQNSKGTK